MDASTGAKPNGNGHADPSPESLPSAVVPSGGPVPGAIAPVAELPEISREKNGRFPKGVSGNPKGKPPGIPNRNSELVKLFTTKELAKVKKLAFEKARKGELALLEFLLDRVLLKQTPDSAGATVNVHQSHQQTTVLQNLDSRLERFANDLRNPNARERLAAYLDELDRGDGVAGENGHERD